MDIRNDFSDRGVVLNCMVVFFFFDLTESDRSEDRAQIGKEGEREREILLLFVSCSTSQQHASVSQGRICSDNFTCCHTEIEVADQTFHLTQSQYTDTGPTSPSTGWVATGVPIFKSLV